MSSVVHPLHEIDASCDATNAEWYRDRFDLRFPHHHVLLSSRSARPCSHGCRERDDLPFQIALCDTADRTPHLACEGLELDAEQSKSCRSLSVSLKQALPRL
jgi:hypothetical protein